MIEEVATDDAAFEKILREEYGDRLLGFKRADF